MRRACLAVLVAASLATQPAWAAEPVVLKSGGPWNVDFAAESCRLARVFGEGENKHYLAFTQYWPGEATGLTIAGPVFKRFRSLAGTDLRFFETQEPMRTTPFRGDVEGFGDAVIYSSITIDKGREGSSSRDQTLLRGWPQLDEALGKQARFVELRQGSRIVRLETGSLDAAFKVMNQCTMDLLREWGLDPERHRTAQSSPRWLNQDALVPRIQADYPAAALSQGEQGIMRMRLIVSEQGTVESCTILKATQTDGLESPACKVMQRAQFEPARDAAGQPFRSLYATSIIYRAG